VGASHAAGPGRDSPGASGSGLWEAGVMTPEETVDAFIARLVTPDLDAACELVSADLEYDNVPMGKNHGPEGLKAFLAPMVDGLDEVEFVVHRQTATGNVVMNERTDRFRLGENWLELPVVGVFELDDDGLITLWRDYFDMQMFNDQMAKLAG
jgi:limonene-1,2-epoxide hydrolase